MEVVGSVNCLYQTQFDADDVFNVGLANRPDIEEKLKLAFGVKGLALTKENNAWTKLEIKDGYMQRDEQWLQVSSALVDQDSVAALVAGTTEDALHVCSTLAKLLGSNDLNWQELQKNSRIERYATACNVKFAHEFAAMLHPSIRDFVFSDVKDAFATPGATVDIQPFVLKVVIRHSPADPKVKLSRLEEAKLSGKYLVAVAVPTQPDYGLKVFRIESALPYDRHLKLMKRLEERMGEAMGVGQ